MKKSGVSLFEILVATMVLSVVLLSLANIFVSVQKNVQHSQCIVVASELGRYFLDPLHMGVDQAAWGTNCLGNNTACISGNLTRNSIVYSVAVATSPVTGLSLRKANVSISWVEGI